MCRLEQTPFPVGAAEAAMLFAASNAQEHRGFRRSHKG